MWKTDCVGFYSTLTYLWWPRCGPAMEGSVRLRQKHHERTVFFGHRGTVTAQVLASSRTHCLAGVRQSDSEAASKRWFYHLANFGWFLRTGTLYFVLPIFRGYWWNIASIDCRGCAVTVPQGWIKSRISISHRVYCRLLTTSLILDC